MSARALHSLVLAWHPLHPPQSGAALRNWQNVRALAQLGPVDVVSVGPGAGGPAPAPVRRWHHFDPARLEPVRGLLEPLLRRSWWVRACRHPWSHALCRPEIVATVRDSIRSGKIDLVVLEEVWFHPYRALAHALGCRTVFDAHNVEGRLRSELAPSTRDGIERLRSRLLLRRTAAIELDLLRQADQVWCCSDEDAARFAATAELQERLHVIPNTIDVEHYAPVRATPRSPPGGPASIVFVGSFSYAPNEEAARILVEQVLPAVRRERADARLVLVGRDPTPWMIAAGEREGGVHVTGAVDDVRPHLAQADVVAVPLLRGGGTRLKLLEAFACLRPVVSTAKGAEGLAVADRQHVLLREPRTFAAAILELLSSPPLATRLVQNALALVEERYSWPVAARRVEAAVRALRCAP